MNALARVIESLTYGVRAPQFGLLQCVVHTVDPKRIRRLASASTLFPNYRFKLNPCAAEVILEINDEAKQIVHELGTAINSAVEQSPQVAEAIERLREAGYEMELTLRLEIALREHTEEETNHEEAALELTDEDMRTLRRMKIRIDSEE